MNKNFCVIPWISLHTYPDGKVAPCSVWNTEYSTNNIKSYTFQGITNSKEFKTIRKDMLDNKIVNGCSLCSKNPTLKNHYNNSFKDEIPNIIKNTNVDGSLINKSEMLYMNIRYSNLCNFKCRTCCQVHSSLIAQENKCTIPVTEISRYIPNYLDIISEELKTVKWINFAGGESTLIAEHWDILDKLIDLNRTNIAITYITNLSKLTYKNKNLIDYAKKFSKFIVICSIDASHERAELYRHGTIWKNTENNLRLLKESKITYKIHCTVGAMNIHHVTDLQKYLLENELIQPESFKISMLVSPKYLSIKILPLDYKIEIADRIEKHIEWLTSINHSFDQWENIIEFMKEDDSHMLPEFLEYNKKLDILRDQNFLNVFPELQKISGAG